MTDREKIHSGEIYFPNGSEIMDEQLAYLDKMDEYNAIPRRFVEKRAAMLHQMFAEVGEGCYIESPFYANWGGHHVHLGKGVYANFGATFVDDTHIYIGDATMLGPNVVIATAGHPIDPELRARALQYNMPVRIGRNCWIGAGAVILPGVSIGDNTVIGAGSGVTKDIPANVVAVGNPCKVLREIGEKDKTYYFKDKKIIAVFGMMRDKDYKYCAEKMASLCDVIYTTTVSNPRSLTAKELAEEVKSHGGKAKPVDDCAKAYKKAIKNPCKIKNIMLY